MRTEIRTDTGRPLRSILIGFGVAIGAAALLALVAFASSRFASIGSAAGDHQVSRAGFESAGLVWPLTVGHGEVGCTGLAAWFEAPDGTTYGLNGFATAQRGYADVTPIWMEDVEANESWRETTGVTPRHPTRVSIGDLLDTANALCDDAN